MTHAACLSNFTTAEIQAACAPLASLIRKSEKALRNLAPGTWQHSMLEDNLNALRMALALMDTDLADTEEPKAKDLETAQRGLAAMISRTEEFLKKSPIGSSQHTLLRNRLKALHIAVAWIATKRVTAGA